MRFAESTAAAFFAAFALAPAAHCAPSERSVHAFDGQWGAWHTHVRRLKRPLSGSTEWVEYDGTTVVHALLDGRANLAELKVAGPAGRIEGAALRLHQPDSGRWTIHYFSAADGQLTPPLAGAFHEGRGTFEGDDTLGDRPIRVRFVIVPETHGGFRFEQSFSGDGGKTWELNWIAQDSRPVSR